MDFSDWPDLEEIASQVKSGQKSATLQVKEALDRIEKTSDYNAVIEVKKDATLQAEKIDQLIADSKDVGRLAGVPFLVKDNYLTYGTDTTASSNMLRGFKAPYQSTVVELLEAEGAIVVGKTNLDAFAHGGSTENSDFEPTLNAIDKSRVPGGSSGGSAAAVALKLTPFALGSDTGGSIRQPASFNGVYGLKPTYGLVSRFGVIAMASSTDVMGPLTANVTDAALLMDIIAIKDPKDSTMIDREEKYEISKTDLKGIKVGLIKEHFGEGISDEVETATLKAAKNLEEKGAEVTEVSLPTLKYALGCYYIVVPAEVSSNLSRYDGVKYGYSDETSGSLNDLYENTRSRGFNDENKRRIMIGTYVLSAGYYDAYYKKSQRVRTKIIDEFDQVFKDSDVLLGPTVPTAAFKLGENTDDPLKMYMADIMTVGMSLAGVPAINVPYSNSESGLPIGVQLTAKQGADNLLLNIAGVLGGNK